MESDAGTRGNPMLQVGGEQEAVTDPDPGAGVVMAQDSEHPPGADNTPGWDEAHVRGILLRTIPPLVFGKEVFAMTSVRTALTVCPVPLAVTNVVWPDCCVPASISRAMVWIGQVSKKSRAGEVAPREF